MIRNPLSFQLSPEDYSKAGEAEKASTNMMRPSSTFFRDGLRRFRKNPVAMTAFIFIAILILAVIIIPFVYPYSYDQVLGQKAGSRVDHSYTLLSPFAYGTTEQGLIQNGEFVWPHIFGTDDQNHDYFIRVVYGTRVSLGVGFFAAIIVLVIGTIIGSIAGYFGGKVDLVLMRIVDLIYSLPDMLIIILLSSSLGEVLEGQTGIVAVLGAGMISIFIVFALLYWVSMARLVRGQILTIRKMEFVMAAKASGASPARIIFKHLIPNSMSVIIISAALQIPSAIFTESFLSYLGLGVKYPMPSLGSLASSSQNYMMNGISSQLYMFLIPAITICLIVLALNLLGDGLRDAFDPKLQK